MTTNLTVIRHDDDNNEQDSAGWRIGSIVSVIAGQIVGELDRCVHRDADGATVIRYEVRIDGVADIGAGLAKIHVDDAQNLRDLSVVVDVLADELSKAQKGDGA